MFQPVSKTQVLVSYKDQKYSGPYLSSSSVLIDLLGAIFKKRYILRTFHGQANLVLRDSWLVLPSVIYVCDIYDVEDFQQPAAQREAYIFELEGQTKRRRELDAERLRLWGMSTRYLAFSCQRQKCFVLISRPNSEKPLERISLSENLPFARSLTTDMVRSVKMYFREFPKPGQKVCSTPNEMGMFVLSSSNIIGVPLLTALIYYLVTCTLSKEECKMIQAEQGFMRRIFGEDSMDRISAFAAIGDEKRKDKAKVKQWRKRRERRENKRNRNVQPKP